MKYQSSKTLDCKDIGIKKSVLVAIFHLNGIDTWCGRSTTCILLYWRQTSASIFLYLHEIVRSALTSEYIIEILISWQIVFDLNTFLYLGLDDESVLFSPSTSLSAPFQDSTIYNIIFYTNVFITFYPATRN